MQKSFYTITLLSGLISFLIYTTGACKKANDSRPTALNQVIPEGFPQPQHTFRNNPLSQEGFELGRKLFYDGQLSVDGLHSCASCHQQIAGFGTYEHDRSHGVNNTHTLRNAPVLFNLAWNTSFHWDGEFRSLEDEAVHPILGQNEMGETFNRVIRKLEADLEYQQLFRQVFHTNKILPIHIQQALAQFTGYITSANSKYDRYKKGLATYTAQEEAGYNIYKVKCANCHPEPLFTDYSYRNIGLPIDPFLNDLGRIRITNNQLDIKSQEDVVAKAEKKLKRLQDDKKDMEDKIRKLQDDIRTNERDQENTQKDIINQKLNLENLRNKRRA